MCLKSERRVGKRTTGNNHYMNRGRSECLFCTPPSLKSVVKAPAGELTTGFSSCCAYLLDHSQPAIAEVVPANRSYDSQVEREISW